MTGHKNFLGVAGRYVDSELSFEGITGGSLRWCRMIVQVGIDQRDVREVYIWIPGELEQAIAWPKATVAYLGIETFQQRWQQKPQPGFCLDEIGQRDGRLGLLPDPAIFF